MDLSPVSGSNRPTPNSTAPSDRTSHSTSGPNNNNNTTNNGGSGPGTHTSSHSRSYETSPALTHQNLHPSSSANTVGNATTAFQFGGDNGGSGVHDYAGMGSGMTPGGFGIGDVGSRDFVVPSWESGGSGMTPVGEGMMGSLMGVGVGGMEMGWDAEIVRDR